MVGVTIYHFDINYLLDLDIFAVDRCLEISRRVKNTDISEQAIAMRVAFNGDKEGFQELLDRYSNVDEEELEQEKVEQNVKKLQGLLGG